MRRALTCDTFLMSANALSMDGQLVNIDGNGNRVAAMIYGPRSVIVVAGMNKAASTLKGAWDRARNTAAPINTQRFGIETPCQGDRTVRRLYFRRLRVCLYGDHADLPSAEEDKGRSRRRGSGHVRFLRRGTASVTGLPARGSGGNSERRKAKEKNKERAMTAGKRLSRPLCIFDGLRLAVRSYDSTG